MAYESRIIVVERHEHGNEDFSWVYAEQIACVMMSKMDDGFIRLFDKEIDYMLYVDSNEEQTQIDKYGEVMTYTDCKTVIDYLEREIASGENYRRLTVLLGLLKGFNEEQWDNIQVVHYGY